jgi:hypothetical protein
MGDITRQCHPAPCPGPTHRYGTTLSYRHPIGEAFTVRKLLPFPHRIEVAGRTFGHSGQSVIASVIR